jgi:hypothetical protein
VLALGVVLVDEIAEQNGGQPAAQPIGPTPPATMSGTIFTPPLTSHATFAGAMRFAHCTLRVVAHSPNTFIRTPQQMPV